MGPAGVIEDIKKQDVWTKFRVTQEGQQEWVGDEDKFGKDTSSWEQEEQRLKCEEMDIFGSKKEV